MASNRSLEELLQDSRRLQARLRETIRQIASKTDAALDELHPRETAHRGEPRPSPVKPTGTYVLPWSRADCEMPGKRHCG